jgi:hypothetical protein
MPSRGAGHRNAPVEYFTEGGDLLEYLSTILIANLTDVGRPSADAQAKCCLVANSGKKRRA